MGMTIAQHTLENMHKKQQPASDQKKLPITKTKQKGTLENRHQGLQSASEHQVATPGWKQMPLASP